jgi:hypothetical protein
MLHRGAESLVAVGRYTSDLDRGDVLGPVDYVMSKFVVREYCHAVEMHQPCFQGRDIVFAPPTLVHLDKLRLYRHACPAGTGPSARIHIEYDATIHAGVPVGVPLRVQGTVAERVVKRGREYIIIDIDLRTASDNRLLIAYRDTVLISYRGKAGAGEGKTK